MYTLRMVEEAQFHLLSSDNKKENLKKFIDCIPALLQKDLPSKRSLPLMHRLVTAGKHPEWERDWVLGTLSELVTQEHPQAQTIKDMKAAENNIDVYLRSAFRKGPQAWRGTKEIRFASTALGGKAASALIQPAMLRRGHLRKLGERTLSGETKDIFAHIETPMSGLSGEAGTPDGIYVGTTEKVDELFNDLCDKCDELYKQAKTLDEYLEVVVFMSLMGSGVIHPFFDGNGRAFAAKLVYDLHKIGYPLKEVPGIGEIEPSLADLALDGVSAQFTSNFASAHGPGLVRTHMINAFLSDAKMRKDYMHQMHDAISAQIKNGAPKDGYLGHLIFSGVEILKLCLSREVMKAQERGEHFGPSADSPFYIGPEKYRDEIGAYIEANRRS